MSKSPCLFHFFLLEPRLALLMIGESTNLVSSLLYTVDAFQRATIVADYTQCGDAVLVPIMTSECPTAESIQNMLPVCDEFLSIGSLCEADAEAQASDSTCMVLDNIDNCDRYDVYRKAQPRCTEVGCAMLAEILWSTSLLSLWATVGVTIGFHTFRMAKIMEQRRNSCRRWSAAIYFAVLFAFLLAVGFLVEGPVAVLVMTVVCPVLPLHLWIMAIRILRGKYGKADEVQNIRRSAALEIPFFNVLVALKLKEPENVQTTKVEQLLDFRKPLSFLLRFVEDMPEIAVAVLDLLYFEFSWVSVFSIAMSVAMVLVALLTRAAAFANDAAARAADI